GTGVLVDEDAHAWGRFSGCNRGRAVWKPAHETVPIRRNSPGLLSGLSGLPVHSGEGQSGDQQRKTKSLANNERSSHMFRSVMFALGASVMVLRMGDTKAQAGGPKVIIGIGGGWYKPWPTYNYYPSYYPVYTEPVVIPVVAPTYALWYKTS